MELFGYEQALTSLLEDPGKALALLDRLTAASVTWAVAQARHGVDAVLISPAFAGGPLLSPRRAFIKGNMNAVGLLMHTTGYGGWDAADNAPYASWRAALLDVASDRPGDRIHGWRARLAASAVGSEPFDAAHRRLESLADDLPDLRCLIHSDLLHYNVLVEGDHITGVLDWGCAMTGDFLYDLAWLCFWQPWYPAWQRIDFVHEARRHYAAIGLAGMAYQAYAGDWVNLEGTAQRTLGLARS